MAVEIPQEYDAWDAREQYDRLAHISQLESSYAWWLWRLFPNYFTDDDGNVIPLAEHHHEHWEWFWGMPANKRPVPLVEIIFRGGGKSTQVELGCVMLGCRRLRNYVLYVCATQEQADDHVQNIASMLESRRLGMAYPEMGNRLIGKFGASRGWRRNRLRTATGFTVDALGLDTASRGVKLEDQRPDVIVFDDVDEDADTDKEVRKKLRIITKRLLPAASTSGTTAVVFAQNLMHERGIAALLSGRHPDPDGAQLDNFIVDRKLIGPVPAVRNAVVEQKNGKFLLTSGVPTWEGMSLARNQEIIDTDGYTSWRTERQHEVQPPPGGMFSHLDFDALLVDYSEVPQLVRAVVAVDPAVTSKDESDSMGISVMAIGVDDMFYALWSYEQRSTPEDAMSIALRRCVYHGADTLVIETDQGGDLWLEKVPEVWAHLIAKCDGTIVEDGLAPHTVEEFCPYLMHIDIDTIMPTVLGLKAGSTQMPKTHRASLMLVDYERGLMRHVRSGTQQVLHAALHRFPKTKPLDLVDSEYWAWTELKYPSSAPMFMMQAGVSGWSPTDSMGFEHTNSVTY